VDSGITIAGVGAFGSCVDVDNKTCVGIAIGVGVENCTMTLGLEFCSENKIFSDEVESVFCAHAIITPTQNTNNQNNSARNPIIFRDIQVVFSQQKLVVLLEHRLFVE
tara:strand:+ start:294 stop:617 length:324 start_codon:yes stop_codon:yes gene_type:complete